MATKYYCDICGLETVGDKKTLCDELSLVGVEDICYSCTAKLNHYTLKVEYKIALIDLCLPKTDEQKQTEFIKYMAKLPTLKNVELVLNMVKTLNLESFISRNMGE